MLEEIKKSAMEQAMKIMSNPKVSQMLSDPRFMKVMTKAFELKTKAEETLKPVTEILRGVKDRLMKAF